MVCSAMYLCYFLKASSHDSVVIELVCPSHTMPTDGLMSFFIGLAYHPLQILYLKSTSMCPSTWNKYWIPPSHSCKNLSPSLYVDFRQFLSPEDSSSSPFSKQN